MPQFSEEALALESIQYLLEFKNSHNFEQVANYIQTLNHLKILVVGEVIIDEYIYCHALGKSGKEAMLVLRKEMSERFAGGILAVSNHISNYCEDVILASCLGSENPEDDFVRNNLRSNIRPFFISKSGSPTIIKRRFLDNYSRAKLLGVYDINDEFLSDDEQALFLRILEEQMRNCDAVVVTDYGHGLITSKIIDFLVENAPFLAVNTQINASNYGFHTVSRYPRADFVCVNEGELRLNYRARRSDLEEITLNLSNQIDCPRILVTRGSNGSVVYDQDAGFYYCPAFSTKVVDRIGAGDAVFAISSLLASQSTPADIINFTANVIGSLAVLITGNQKSINKDQLFLAIRGLLDT